MTERPTVQSNMTFVLTRGNLDTDTERVDDMTTQGGGGHLQATKEGLRRNQP